MRKFLPLLLATCLCHAAEPSRTWTDTKGRKVEGTLLSKTETTADVLLKGGKRSTMKLADLSESDREYVAKAEVFPPVEMLAKTVAAESNEKGTQKDARKVSVEVTEMHGRKYSATIHWLGPKGSTVGIYKSQTLPVGEDGKVSFSVTYKDAGKGSDYKGYVVGLKEEGNAVWAAKSASQKPFERFLDEAK